MRNRPEMISPEEKLAVAEFTGKSAANLWAGLSSRKLPAR